MSWKIGFVSSVAGCLLLSGCATGQPDLLNAPAQETISTSVSRQSLMDVPFMQGESLLGNKKIGIGGERQTIQVLNVWASWCQPCIDEAPALVAFDQSKPKGVELIGINASKYDDRDEVLDFIDRYHWKYPQIWDADGTITKKLRAISYPTTAVVNRKGEVVWLHSGPLSAKQLLAVVKQVEAFHK